MPRNIIDKLAWWIPNKEKRKQFRYDINKVVIDFIINDKEEFNSKYPDLYNNLIDSFFKYITDIPKEELKSKYPDLYNNFINSFLKHLTNIPKKEFIETYPEFYNNIKNNQTRNSKIINKYLLGLKGIEIGGASYADYGIDAINIDRIDTNVNNNIYYDEQTKNSGYLKKVDLISKGDDLPFKDNTIDFVFTSHVIEHFYDPIKALKEWYRVIKKDGYIFIIAPHKERTFDKDRERTTLQELIDRHKGTLQLDNKFDDTHHSVWITEDFLELCKYLNFNVVEYQDADDFMGIGFTIVIKK